jgi:hypothetical protein
MKAIPKDERMAAYWAVVKTGYFFLDDVEPRYVAYMVNVALRAAADIRQARQQKKLRNKWQKAKNVSG